MIPHAVSSGASVGRRRPRLLVVIPYYLPGFKAGGPIRSIDGLVDELGDELDIYIVTLDRDFGDLQPYRGIRPGEWTRMGKATVMYLPPRSYLRSFTRLLSAVSPDILYINVLFSFAFTVVPLLAQRRSHSMPRIVLAPRGSLSGPALRIKWWKKIPFLLASRAMHLFSRVAWQASSPAEKWEIWRAIGPSARVVVTPNLQRRLHAVRPRRPKRPGTLRAVYISRISPKKNLSYLLEALTRVRGRVEMDIIGPVDDEAYWRGCQRRMASLPEAITVEYGGEISHGLVAEELADHELLVLPTLNENFGHVILESLSVGTPVLISSKTPWRNLASQGAGWDVDLNDTERFRAALDRCIGMDAQEFAAMSATTSAFAADWFSRGDAVSANRRLFADPQ